MRYFFYSSQDQYDHHLMPVWDALSSDEQGEYDKQPRNYQRSRYPKDAVIVVAAIGDFKKFCVRRNICTMKGHYVSFQPDFPTVLFEHGVGYSFHGDTRRDLRHGSYAGGLHRDKAVCLPAVNRWVSEPNQERFPNVPSPIVGCPKLDKLVKLPKPKNEKPVVCVSFHWDCGVAPETRWAFSWYGAAINDLRDMPGIELIAHGHPRAHHLWRKWYPLHHIEYVPDFEEVCARADVYCNDSSSTLYEFAALDRPVVVLNAPWYRREVQHGLRFWTHADVGIQAEEPSDLVPAVQAALRDPAGQRKRRRSAIAEVYPHLGTSTERAVEVLRGLGI